MTRSLAAEARVTLLGECGNALGIVLRPAELALKIALRIELLLERASPGFVDRLLRACEAACRCRGELFGERVHGVLEFRVIDASPDEPPLRCLLRGKLVG